MNNKKITNKYLGKVIATSVISIVLCMMCLASLTWAWFTFDVQSSGNTLRSAEFDATVYVTPSDPSLTEYRNVVFAPSSYKVYVKQNASAKTGYCLVTIDGKTYFAGELKEKLNADTRTAYCALEFDFEIATAPAIVSIDPVWGMYFGSYDVLPHDEPIEGSSTVVPPITVEETAADTDETTSPEETTLTPSETVAPEEESTDTTAEPTETAEPVETEAETTAEPTETTKPEVTESEETESEETEAETISEPSETIEPEETDPQEPSAEADFE